MALGGLFILNLLLRVFYFRFDFVNGDEMVRALTALRLIEGATLYVDVVTDKPPGATLFYAAVFKLFGKSMPAVHLAATLWNYGTALLVYFTARRLYDARTGLWAALLFVYFSTNYHAQDMMAANTELLLILPYTASFYFFAVACLRGANKQAPLFLAGVFAGFSVVFKQVGVLAVISFGLGIGALEIIRRVRRSDAEQEGWFASATRIGRDFGFVLAGFLAVIGIGALWLKTGGALGSFWRNTVAMGVEYAGSLPPGTWLKFMFSRVTSYILFNATLWALAAMAVVVAARHGPRQISKCRADDKYENDLLVLLWTIISLGGAFTGGRFFGHYFITALPALSILGSRGLTPFLDRIKKGEFRNREKIAVALLLLPLIVGFVRFHTRSVLLAYERITGSPVSFAHSWGIAERERQTEEMVQYVREHVAPGEPLYIWGYALEVYWQTGCRPASRYLTPYYVTGHFYPEVLSNPKAIDDPFWKRARAELIEDLSRERPKLILNIDEAIFSLPYPEIIDFVRSNYRLEANVGSDSARQFLVFRLKEKTKKTGDRELSALLK